MDVTAKRAPVLLKRNEDNGNISQNINQRTNSNQRTKLVIRYLPPAMTQDEFFALVASYGLNNETCNYKCYVQGKIPSKTTQKLIKYSRAYAGFRTQDMLRSFYRRFKTELAPQIDNTSGSDDKVRIEFAPFQRPYDENLLKNAENEFQGTINDDLIFKSFVAHLSDPNIDILPLKSEVIEVDPTPTKKPKRRNRKGKEKEKEGKPEDSSKKSDKPARQRPETPAREGKEKLETGKEKDKSDKVEGKADTDKVEKLKSHRRRKQKKQDGGESKDNEDGNKPETQEAKSKPKHRPRPERKPKPSGENELGSAQAQGTSLVKPEEKKSRDKNKSTNQEKGQAKQKSEDGKQETKRPPRRRRPPHRDGDEKPSSAQQSTVLT